MEFDFQLEALPTATVFKFALKQSVKVRTEITGFPTNLGPADTVYQIYEQLPDDGFGQDGPHYLLERDCEAICWEDTAVHSLVSFPEKDLEVANG